MRKFFLQPTFVTKSSHATTMVRTGDNLQISELNEPEEKTMLDRITDIVTLEVFPRKFRARTSEIFRTLMRWGFTGFSWGSWFAWVAATGLIVLVLPVYRALDNDNVLLEQIEQEIAMTQRGKFNDLQVDLGDRYK